MKITVLVENITAVFGGFHIVNPVTRRNKGKSYIDRLASELTQYYTVFYTGHCTGRHNVDYLTQKLGSKIKAINSGDVIEL
jgi:7,8-dihydropterin-6-yl-methyl-4-(beta-D-ribofuranosyl)aminobenzene 5'-phosphate synthase